MIGSGMPLCADDAVTAQSGWYLSRAAPSSGYGAAGALIDLMLWTHYPSQIFLFGAKITKAIVDLKSKPEAVQG
jgi:uncharacterized BrkB/YihY/UPF0761 family membrane protein